MEWKNFKDEYLKGNILVNIEMRLSQRILINTSILWLLCSNKGKVVSVDQIFHDLWGEKYYTNSSSSIMVHIRHLREKMNDSAENPRYIQTVWGVGYKIE